jgi:hypothetical protein
VQLGGVGFRKSYGFIHKLRAFVRAPLSVCTVTLTPMIKKGAIAKTGLRADSLFELILSPDRSNLNIVRSTANDLCNENLNNSFLRAEGFIDIQNRKPNNESIRFFENALIEKGLETIKFRIFAFSTNKVTDVLFWLRENVNDEARVWRDGKLHG